MDVVARLSAPLLSLLRAALRNEHSLIVADDWRILTEIVRLRPVDLAVVDPRADGATRTVEIRDLLLLYPSLPVVLYTGLAVDTVRTTTELAPLGLTHVVLRGFDDDAPRLREVLERVSMFEVSEALLERLAAPVTASPPLLGRAIVRLFREPHTFRSVNDLAETAGIARRSLDRWLEKQGLASARMLIALARLARAYHYLRDPGCMAEDVASKMGYPSPRLFATHTREVTGLNPTVLRQELTQEAFTERLAVLLWQRPGSASDVRSDKAHTGSR